MSTIQIGDALEDEVFDLLNGEISAGRFFAKSEHCKVRKKPPYFSRDRGKDIIFDLSVEIFLPGQKNPSVIVLIECKNYSGTVPVNDLEEFFSKIQQVGGANCKGVVASRTAFQSGAVAFAKSKGIGLFRYFGGASFKWELLRSPSACARSIDVESNDSISRALTEPEFACPSFDLYLLSPKRLTNSIWDFFEDTVVTDTLTPAQSVQIANDRSRGLLPVPFLENDHLETIASHILETVNYQDGAVSLEAVLAHAQEKSKLRLFTDVEPSIEDFRILPLGKIIFEPLEIHIFKQVIPNEHRQRFTLAHELSHYFLDHGRFMSKEYCDENDFIFERASKGIGVAVSRMEFQANFLAAAILMPKTFFVIDFWKSLIPLDLPNHGYGRLFVDNQPCNIASYISVMNSLTRKYRVSRTAASIRLQGLGLLTDARQSVRAETDWRVYATSGVMANIED